MKSKRYFLFITSLLLLFICKNRVFAQQKVIFPASDGLTVTGDLYHVSDSLPVILLCHQAHYSRGEYAQTALKLTQYGFNCLAIDQRYGDEINGIKNETALEAARVKKTSGSADAEQDITGAIDYLYEKYKKRILLLGSSYSASLVLKIAKENDRIFAAAAFSPGEYFEKKDFVANHISGLNKPVFVTSSKQEADEVTNLVKDVISMIKIQYIPISAGEHGSKVLWSIQPFNEEYWIALMSFLERMKKIEQHQ